MSVKDVEVFILVAEISYCAVNYNTNLKLECFQAVCSRGVLFAPLAAANRQKLLVPAQ